MSKPNPMGGTFAERTAAREGKASFNDPTPNPANEFENTTFAERAKAAKKTASKAVESDGAENKAVAKKTASKKS
jgi:hypothetical protein